MLLARQVSEIYCRSLALTNMTFQNAMDAMRLAGFTSSGDTYQFNRFCDSCLQDIVSGERGADASRADHV